MLSKRKILAVHLSIWDVGFGMLSCLVALLFFCGRGPRGSPSARCFGGTHCHLLECIPFFPCYLLRSKTCFI